MSERQSVDFWLLITAVVLSGVGLVMVYSSSMYLSMDKIGDGMFYFKKQAVRLLFGLGVMMVLTKLNYRGYANLAKALLVLGYVVLAMLLAKRVLHGGDVERWIYIGGFSLQPSEFMKVVTVIYLSASLARKGEKIRDFGRGFLPLLAALAGVSGLIVFEPDLSTAGLIFLIGLVVLFIGRAKLVHLAAVTMPAFAVMALFVRYVPYMQNRVKQFLESGGGYQVKQSIIAIGSGGLFGVGLGNSNGKFYFLPERHTDFVFSIFAEEAGLVGSVILLGLMFFYVYRGFRIARHAPDMFGFLLASGLSVMFGVQVFINVGVATKLLPATGMTLPFISYGGSSLLLSFIVTGILLNISREADYERRLSREFGSRLQKRSVW